MKNSDKYIFIKSKNPNRAGITQFLFTTKLFNTMEITDGVFFVLDGIDLEIDIKKTSSNLTDFLDYIDDSKYIEAIVPSLIRKDKHSFSGVVLKKSDILSGKALAVMQSSAAGKAGRTKPAVSMEEQLQDYATCDQHWLKGRIIPPSAIYTAARPSEMQPSTRYRVRFDQEILARLGIRKLKSTALDCYKLQKEMPILYSANGTRLSNKELVLLNEGAWMEEAEDPHSRIPVTFTQFNKVHLNIKGYPDDGKAFDFSSLVAAQNLSKRQKDALYAYVAESLGKTYSKNFAVAYLTHREEAKDPFSQMIDTLNLYTDQPLTTLDNLMPIMMSLMANTLSDFNRRDIQPIILSPVKANTVWEELIAKAASYPDSRITISEAFWFMERIRKHELAVLFLPSDQSIPIDKAAIEKFGFEIESNPEIAIGWIRNVLEPCHSDIIKPWIDELKEKTATESKTAESARLAAESEHRKAIDAAFSPAGLKWNYPLLNEKGSDILALPFRVSAAKTTETVFTAVDGSPLLKTLSSYVKPGTEGLSITTDVGIALSTEHDAAVKRLIGDHLERLTELRRLSESSGKPISVDWFGKEHRPGREDDPIQLTTDMDVIGDESVAGLVSSGKLSCSIVYRPDIGIDLTILSSSDDRLFSGFEDIADTPDIGMMRAIGQNPSRSAFKRLMSDLERYELRTDAVEVVEAVLEAEGNEAIPELKPISHPIEITAPKGTIYGLVEDIVLLPNGKKAPKAYISIWSADMSGKYKAILDVIPEELSKRISVLLLMMRSDEKILEIIETLPGEQRGKGSSSKNGKKSGGTRSVKTVSLTREFRHRMMNEKKDRISIPRSTEGKILSDVSVRKHVRYQAYGPGYSMHRLITIESYAKKMFVNPGTSTTRVIR